MNQWLLHMGVKAKQASKILMRLTSLQKNQLLEKLALLLEANQEEILKANERDIIEAKTLGLEEALLDRLSLKGRLKGIIADIAQVITLPDPVGEIFDKRILKHGLHIYKKRVPIGVIGVIYEARPNVTIDIAILCLKSGNAAILRGGAETVETNKVLIRLIHDSLKAFDLPSECIQFIENTDRAVVLDLLKMYETIDLIIPRGGEGLQRFCRENSTIPVITGGIGICHLYVDQTVDLEKSLEVIDNAKTQRPTVCNALDTLLVHKEIASKIIPRVVERLSPKWVSFHLDQKALQYVETLTECVVAAKEGDWDREWLSLVLGIKVVDSIEEAIQHINKHGSGHSDGILTSSERNAQEFIEAVDSAAVYINTSTRFTDGSQFGLGGEIAVSTQKIHARGPMGLKELTSYKWIGTGDYLVRKS